MISARRSQGFFPITDVEAARAFYARVRSPAPDTRRVSLRDPDCDLLSLFQDQT